MSQALPGANSVLNTGNTLVPHRTVSTILTCHPIGSHHYPPQSAQNQTSAPGVSHFIDGSGPIFSMYLERAEEEDKKMAESWKADADGILIFVRLFF